MAHNAGISCLIPTKHPPVFEIFLIQTELHQRLRFDCNTFGWKRLGCVRIALTTTAANPAMMNLMSLKVVGPIEKRQPNWIDSRLQSHCGHWILCVGASTSQ
jgi:hypothetical protein